MCVCCVCVVCVLCVCVLCECVCVCVCVCACLRFFQGTPPNLCFPFRLPFKPRKSSLKRRDIHISAHPGFSEHRFWPYKKAHQLCYTHSQPFWGPCKSLGCLNITSSSIRASQGAHRTLANWGLIQSVQALADSGCSDSRVRLAQVMF